MKQLLIKIHLLAFSLLIAFPLFAQEVSTTTQVFTGPDFGTTILVPINSSNITATYGNIIIATIRVEYNTDVLTYIGYTNLNPAIPSSKISVMPNGTGGVVQLNIEDPEFSGFPWPDGKAFDLQFTFNGGPTAINITNAEFLNDAFETDNSPVVNGNVSGYTNLTASNGDWHQASTWTGYLGGLTAPGLGHNVTILPGGTVTIGADAVCNSLTINNGGQLTLDAGKTLTDNGNFQIASGGSFIQNGTLAITGTTTVKRDIAANEWHLISAPISDALSGMFFDKVLQTHNELTNEYTDIADINVPLTPVKGYALAGEGGFTANYVGTLNTGSQSIATTKDGAGWNLVGNPYPSAINWNAASGWTKTNLNATTYLHVNSSTWATWNGATGTNGGSQYIAPGQGFFVEATGAGTLAMTDAVRVHNPVSFFKNTVNNLVRLQVSGNGYTDDAVVYFVPEATAEFDGQYDAHKLFGDVAEAAQIYTLGSSPLAINALPETNSVPVGIHAGTSGTYTIAATEVNDIQAITLKDNQTGISTNLLVNSYSFSFTPGENEQRFTLYFSPLSINEVENPLAAIYSNQNTLYVDLKSLSKGDIYVYNLAGQLVTSTSANQGMNMIRLTNTGNYIVKVITPKTTLVKKVFIQ